MAIANITEADLLANQEVRDHLIELLQAFQALADSHPGALPLDEVQDMITQLIDMLADMGAIPTPPTIVAINPNMIMVGN